MNALAAVVALAMPAIDISLAGATQAAARRHDSVIILSAIAGVQEDIIDFRRRTRLPIAFTIAVHRLRIDRSVKEDVVVAG